MAATVNTNMMSLNAQRHLTKNASSLSTAMERLASGLRVNSAKDDAAGLAISSRMTAQISGSQVAVRNAADGISLAQTAEGAMDSLGGMLNRMRDLAVQSLNGSNSSGDRSNLDTEYKQLAAELKRVIQGTKFNGNAILNGKLNGTSSNVVFQVGANAAATDKISIVYGNLSTQAGIKNVASGGTSITAVGAASAAVAQLDTAITTITTIRAKLGAAQNRLTATIGNLQNSIENQSAARSRIMDTDFASETASLSRAQILQQAGTAMLSQANQAPQSVLSLLR